MVKRVKPKVTRRRPTGRQVRPSPRKGTRYSRPLQQGVGRIPNGGIQNRKPTPRPLSCYADALQDAHLPLPRAIGGYSVVRTTEAVLTTSKVAIFGCFRANTSSISTAVPGNWNNIVGVSAVSSDAAMNATDNTYTMNAPGISIAKLGSASTLVPAAITVQIMNPEALQNTHGMVMAGVMNQVPRLCDDTRTWDQFANEFISFNKPRLMSAGKLALRGVQASTVPMNMSSLSEFTEVAASPTTTSTTWNAFELSGMAPIVISNPSGIELSYLVTVEWRLRFDISHPAASTHITRQPATDSTWAALLKHLQSFGHGVKDIADVVADLGIMASRSPLALGM